METHSFVGQLNAGAPLLLVLMKKHPGPLVFPEHERRQQLGLGKRTHGSVKRKKRESDSTSVVLVEAAWLAKVPRKL